MAVELNHTIVGARDQRESAEFLSDILGLDPPTQFGPFLVVEVANGVSLDFDERPGDIPMDHYAFLVSEDDFDAIITRPYGSGSG